MCAAIWGRDAILIKLLDKMKPCINNKAEVMYHMKDLDPTNIVVVEAEKMNRKKEFGCFTPLMFAVFFGHLNTIKILLNNGANYRIRDSEHGDSILHIAAKNKQLEILEWLCKHIKDFDHFCTNDKGDNAF